MEDLLVMAQIAGRRCAFDAHEVQSVIDIGTVTPVPGTPDHIVGITALRSQALTVIDCRRALGADPEKWDLDTRAIVVSFQGHSYALKVDLIEDIADCIAQPDEVLGGFGVEWSRVAKGMVETTDGPALLLDISRLIDANDDLGAAA